MSWMVSVIIKALQKTLVDQKLNQIIGLLEEIRGKEETMSAEMDALIAQVAESIAVEQSAILLIQGFAAQLEAAGTDPVKLAELKAALDASEQNLAAAVAANTPIVEPPVAP
jgi:uncharacterized membrane protein